MENATPTALLLNLPEKALAGVDLLSFTTTSRFQGIKSLTSGLHFLFTGSSAAFSVRHGAWFTSRSNPPSLFVTRWEPTTEDLAIENDDAELLRRRANLGQMWRENLTPYRQSAANISSSEPQTEDGDWSQLTSHISSAVLTRVLRGDWKHWTLTSASSAARDIDEIPGLSAEESRLEPEKELLFLPVDLKQTWRSGAVGRERTDAAQDRSWALAELIQQHTSGDPLDIIGELQFCFLMVLTLNNFSCLEQWKRILTLLFTCKAAVSTRSEMFVQGISALKAQLQHCKDAEGGLFDLADEGGSLLKDLVVRFRKGLDGLGGTGVQDVTDELDDLEEFLREEFGWQFGGTFARSGVLELEDGEQVRMETTAFDEDDETGEYAPQVVDLTPEQARLLGLGNAGDLANTMGKASLHEPSSEEEEDEIANGATTTSDARSDEESEAAEDLDDMDSRF